MLTPRLERPRLRLDLGRPMSVLSWALNRPGFVTARQILWREVRDDDLPADLDVEAWLKAELDARGAADAVAFLTSRDIGMFERGFAESEGASAGAVVTLGLSNAERVGSRRAPPHQIGTINIAVCLNMPLTTSAVIEALSIAVEARTAAVIAAGLMTPGGAATGTGTDCVAIAAPTGGDGLCFAGLHTAMGEAVGKAVLEAVGRAAAIWMKVNQTANRRAPGMPWKALPIPVRTEAPGGFRRRLR